MSKKPESRFIDRVHRQLSEKVYKQAFTSKFSNGTPDRYYEGPKGVLWIEYKYIDKLPNVVNLTDISKKPCLSKLQQNWLIRAHKNNIQVGVALGYKDFVFWYPGIFWQAYIVKEIFLKKLISIKDFAKIIENKVL